LSPTVSFNQVSRGKNRWDADEVEAKGNEEGIVDANREEEGDSISSNEVDARALLEC